jgi:hypothetical protein
LFLAEDAEPGLLLTRLDITLDLVALHLGPSTLVSLKERLLAALDVEVPLPEPLKAMVVDKEQETAEEAVLLATATFLVTRPLNNRDMTPSLLSSSINSHRKTKRWFWVNVCIR